MKLPRIAAVAALVLVAVLAGAPASAAPDKAPGPAPGWYMLVNDYYDGTNGVGGPMRCLSTNAQTSSSGPGTHMVYLAGCNPSTPAQWWYFNSNFMNGYLADIDNYANFSGKSWELSSNLTTPPGHSVGTYGVYTAQESNVSAHQWRLWDAFSGVNTFSFQNERSLLTMSASAANPYPAGTFRVYTAATPSPLPPAHVWRFYQPGQPPGL